MEKKYRPGAKKTVDAMPSFPMRINKYLAHKGYSSRREADGLIVAKKVMINGSIAVLGDKVSEKDIVEVRKPALGTGSDAARVYLAYHKPVGVVTALPRDGEKAINDILQYKKQPVSPIGRLDKATHGLMILTNDTRITGRMLNPSHLHEKEYTVRLNKHFSPSLLAAIERSAGTKAERLTDNQFKAIVTGSGPDIRTICNRLNFEVSDMVRTRIINVRLGDLKEGEHREIVGNELKEFLLALGL